MAEAGFEELKETIIDAGLCTGCGGCVASCPASVLEITENGIELRGECISCGTCLRICPGRKMDFGGVERRIHGRKRRGLRERFSGIKRRRYNLKASDREVFRAGYFGGAITAVLISALERGDIDAALLTDWSRRDGVLSFGSARIARTRGEIIACASSKYVLSPVLSLLRDISADRSINKVAVVGLPCHVHALRTMEADPVASKMVSKVRYIIGLNCGSPNVNEEDWRTIVGELAGLERENILQARIRKVSSRKAILTVIDRGGDEISREIDLIRYMKMVNRYPSWPRCDLCPDYSNELSDISFGGPTVRTEAGEYLLTGSLESGCLHRGTFKRGTVQRVMDLILSRRKRRRAFKMLRKRRSSGRAVPEYGYN